MNVDITFPCVKYWISTFTPWVKWFFFKVKNVASRWICAKKCEKMSHELRKKIKKIPKIPVRNIPFLTVFERFYRLL